MNARNYRDLAGGALFLVFGVTLAGYTASHFDLGTLRSMGAGFFPAALGVILAGLGLILLVQAFFTSSETPEIRVWSPLFVLLGVAAFALTIRPLGLIPAVVAVTFITALAELKVRPVATTLLTAVLCLIAWLIFSVALGLPITMIRWPL